MSKIAIVYWSGTGNTEAMAEMIRDAAEASGNQADMYTASDFSEDKIDNYEGIAFGCPAMGAEELEDGEFLPMWENISAKLGSKKVALFGSYGWGDGEWMRLWDEDSRNKGINIACDFVICQDAPDDDARSKLTELSGKLV